jgi:hypothetical protein
MTYCASTRRTKSNETETRCGQKANCLSVLKQASQVLFAEHQHVIE